MNPAIEYIAKLAAGTALAITGAACGHWVLWLGIALVVEPVAASYVESFVLWRANKSK